MKKILIIVLILIGVSLIPTYYGFKANANELTLEERNEVVSTLIDINTTLKDGSIAEKDIQTLLEGVDKDLLKKYASENEYASQLIGVLGEESFNKEIAIDMMLKVIETEMFLFNELMDTVLTDDIKNHITEIIGKSAPVTAEEVNNVTKDMLQVLNTVVQHDGTSEYLSNIKTVVDDSELRQLLDKLEEFKQHEEVQRFKVLLYDILGKEMLNLSDDTVQEYIQLVTTLSGEEIKH